MATVTFDTHKFILKLKESGVPEKQAEAFSDAQKELLSEIMSSSLATKDDIHRLELELAVMKWMLGTIIGGVVALLFKAFIK